MEPVGVITIRTPIGYGNPVLGVRGAASLTTAGYFVSDFIC